MVQPGEWGLVGSGIATRSLKEAIQIGKLIEKHGYHRVYDMHQKKIMGWDYHFGYLPASSKLARELAQNPYAYGDYVEKVRRKYRIK